MFCRSFSPDKTAVFVSRPNRFAVTAETENGKVHVHCPNPGRLREILIPGRRLILEKSDNPARKTEWTLAAAEYSGEIIPLISVRANILVGTLVLRDIYPDFNFHAEKQSGTSRFDWFLENDGAEIWVEVKACTLVEHGRALFPDAPSLRAVKHTKELISISGRSAGEIVFAVMNPSASVFSPNPHTDPELCLVLKKAADSGVKLRAVSFRTGEDGLSRVVNPDIPIDLSSAGLADADSGLIIRVWEYLGSRPVRVVTYKYCGDGLRKTLRSKTRTNGPPGSGYRQTAVFPVFGNLKSFQFFKEELEEFSGPLDYDPLTSPAFLNLILKYRHKLAFNS